MREFHEDLSVESRISTMISELEDVQKDGTVYVDGQGAVIVINESVLPKIIEQLELIHEELVAALPEIEE